MPLHYMCSAKMVLVEIRSRGRNLPSSGTPTPGGGRAADWGLFRNEVRGWHGRGEGPKCAEAGPSGARPSGLLEESECPGKTRLPYGAPSSHPGRLGRSQPRARRRGLQRSRALTL